MMDERRARSLQGGRWTALLRGLLWGCVIAVAVLIFLFSAQDGPDSSAASDVLARFIAGLIDPEAETLPETDQRSVLTFVRKLVRKGAHFSEFAALGFFIRLLVSTYGLRRPTRLSWLAGTLYACTDELHQLFVADRAGMWQDVLLDSCGVLGGVTAAYALLVLWQRYGRRLRRFRRT